MPDATITENFGPVDEVGCAIVPAYVHYGTLDEANRYFGSLIHGDQWLQFNNAKRKQGMVNATQIIDQLRYSGVANGQSQFPRNGDTEVPKAIRLATYELALELLKGTDADTQYSNLFTTSNRFGAISTTFDRSSVPENIVSGVPSLAAWRYLLPYLKRADDLILRRA